MKKLCIILSIAGHALLLLIALNADFPIAINPAPPRVIAVEIAEPPLPFFKADSLPKLMRNIRIQPATASSAGRNYIAATTTGASAGTPVQIFGKIPFPAPEKFSLMPAAPGAFMLAPAGRGMRPPAGLNGPIGAPRLREYSATAYNPGIIPGGAATQGGAVLMTFDIKEKAVAAWTEAVLARIERNWIIPPLARLSFSGQVQITLTIEKDGFRQALVIDDSSLPGSLAQSALQAVQASLPLPPLPENIAGRTFAFTFIFVYNG
jgi:outer membrane biosynthesis protein TonB